MTIDLPNNPREAERLFGYNNPEWYRRFLKHLRYAIDRRSYPLFAEIAANFVNDQAAVPKPVPEPGDERFECDMTALNDDGLCRLGPLLSASQISEVLAKVKHSELKDQWEIVPGMFQHVDIPSEVHVATYLMPTILTVPHLVEIANHPDVLARVTRYLGAPPTIQTYEMWWSLAGREKAMGPQLFHEDRHCYKFLKLFVYLTDVDMNAGPHVYVRGSASTILRERRLEAMKKLSAAAGHAAQEMLSTVRISDRDISLFFGDERIETVTGKAGDSFLADTAGFHKGLLPTQQDRLVFQVLYTLLPTIRDEVRTRTIPGFTARLMKSHSDPAIEKTIRYANRLIVNDPQTLI
ncbi:MAG: hypothetical protein CMM47_01895 [Rhodospirillaceae bacterium]|nr:hypothetical protein [Rhodospirillaceae bacterium]